MSEPRRIRVRKPYLFRCTWVVEQVGGQGFYVKGWREAIDLAMKWAYTGEHP